MKTPVHLPTQERGAVLIVALVMLLLLTVIGLSSMRGTSLQETMAGNLRDTSLAQQAAEAALRAGEEDVTNLFTAGTLSSLDNTVTTPRTGSYAAFPGTAQEPEYDIVLMAKIRTSTEAGVPTDDEGALVRVKSSGYGLNTETFDNSQLPVSHIKLRSTFLVEQ